MFSIGLGTYKLDKETAYLITKKALELGYRHIDTAALYKTEEPIGRAIKDSDVDRSEIFITTKVWIRDIIKDKIVKSVKRSLKLLQTDTIDLLLLHAPIRDKLEESWKEMEKIFFGEVEGVHVRHIGVSNYTIEDLERIDSFCRVKPFTNQIEVTPFLQRRKLVDHCLKNNIIVTAHTSLTKGEKLDHPLLCTMAEKYEVTPAQILLVWGIIKGLKIIPRTSNIDHLIENYNSVNLIIKEEDIQLLDTLEEGFSTHPKYIS